MLKCRLRGRCGISIYPWTAQVVAVVGGCEAFPSLTTLVVPPDEEKDNFPDGAGLPFGQDFIDVRNEVIIQIQIPLISFFLIPFPLLLESTITVPFQKYQGSSRRICTFRVQ